MNLIKSLIFVSTLFSIVFSVQAEDQAQIKELSFEHRLGTQAAQVASTLMPRSAESANVTRGGEARYNPECGRYALQISRNVLIDSYLKTAAWSSLKSTYKITKNAAQSLYGGKKVFRALNVLKAILTATLDKSSGGTLSVKAGTLFRELQTNFTNNVISDYFHILGNYFNIPPAELEQNYLAYVGGSLSDKVLKTTLKEINSYINKLAYNEFKSSFKGYKIHSQNCKADIDFNLEMAPFGAANEPIIRMDFVGDCDSNFPIAGQSGSLEKFHVIGKLPIRYEYSVQGKIISGRSSVDAKNQSWSVVAYCEKEIDEEPDPVVDNNEVFVSNKGFKEQDRVCTDEAEMTWLAYDLAKFNTNKYRREKRKKSEEYKKEHGIQKAEVEKLKAELDKREAELKVLLSASQPDNAAIILKRGEVNRAKSDYGLAEGNLVAIDKNFKSDLDRLKKLIKKNEDAIEPNQKAYVSVLKQCMKKACRAGKEQEFGDGSYHDWTSDYEAHGYYRKAIQLDILKFIKQAKSNRDDGNWCKGLENPWEEISSYSYHKVFRRQLELDINPTDLDNSPIAGVDKGRLSIVVLDKDKARIQAKGFIFDSDEIPEDIEKNHTELRAGTYRIEITNFKKKIIIENVVVEKGKTTGVKVGDFGRINLKLNNNKDEKIQVPTFSVYDKTAKKILFDKVKGVDFDLAPGKYQIKLHDYIPVKKVEVEVKTMDELRLDVFGYGGVSFKISDGTNSQLEQAIGHFKYYDEENKKQQMVFFLPFDQTRVGKSPDADQILYIENINFKPGFYTIDIMESPIMNDNYLLKGYPLEVKGDLIKKVDIDNIGTLTIGNAGDNLNIGSYLNFDFIDNKTKKVRKVFSYRYFQELKFLTGEYTVVANLGLTGTKTISQKFEIKQFQNEFIGLGLGKLKVSVSMGNTNVMPLIEIWDREFQQLVLKRPGGTGDYDLPPGKYRIIAIGATTQNQDLEIVNGRTESVHFAF